MNEIQHRKVAVVTGAARGIGAAIARRLAADGFIVGLHHGRSAGEAQRLQQRIGEDGGVAFTFGADLSQPDAAQRFFAALDGELERLTASRGFDALVNNAAVAPLANVRRTTPEQFDSIFAVNVRATFFLAQEAAQRLRDGGRIVNLSSVVSRATVPQMAAYAMSKAAINTLTRLLAVELGPRGICVNAVAPGVTVTEMSQPLFAQPGASEAIVKLNAIPRLGQPDDIASVVSFLCGPDSGWVTGQVIEASGGSRL